MTRELVSPETARAVFERDRGCRVGALLGVSSVGPCTGVDRVRRGFWEAAYLDLTIAHVRDRGKGGRLGRRPASTRRHLVACCHRHHQGATVAFVDLAFVRDALDRWLEENEGPDQDDGNRPWEAVPRVRSARNRDGSTLTDAEDVPASSAAPTDGEEEEPIGTR